MYDKYLLLSIANVEKSFCQSFHNVVCLENHCPSFDQDNDVLVSLLILPLHNVYFTTPRCHTTFIMTYLILLTT